MITQQDLETLERLYTPLSKILREHLRIDHGYSSLGNRFAVLSNVNKQQAKRIRELMNEVDETIKEFNSLKSDYEKILKINEYLFQGRPH